MSTEAKFCGNCGVRLRPGSRFCASCGEASEAARAVPAAQQPRPVTPSPQPLPQPPRAAAQPPAVPHEAWAVASTPAPLLRRFVALVIDGLAISGALFLIGVLVANTTDDTTEYGFQLSGAPAGIVVLVGATVFFAYFILFEGLLGATLGKQAMAIRVERTGGGAIGMGAAVVRNLLRIVDGIAAYLVGLIAALLSPRRQRIGDRAAGTVVTRTGRPGGARLAALAAALVLGVMLGGAGVLLRSPAVASVSVTATLARDATREHQAVDPTTRFPPSAGAFVVVFRAEGGKSGDEVKSVWYAVDVGNAALPNTRIDEAGVTLDAPDQAGTFRLRRGQNPWPVGQYKVELYVNGDLAETLDFSVAR